MSCRHKRGPLKGGRWEILHQNNEALHKKPSFYYVKSERNTVCFDYANLDEKKGSDFSITLTANVTTRLRFMKGCSCFAGCCWQLALVWMGRAMYWHQRSSKSWLRKPFGFSKGITRSRYPIPSDFNNHQIASEKLNPSISTNPLEGNQFREISTEANEPSSSCMACEKSWRHWQKNTFMLQ